MTDNPIPNSTNWRQSRYALALTWFSSLVVGWTILRIVLLANFSKGAGLTRVMGSGLIRDCFMGLLETLPLLFWFALLSNRQFAAKWHKRFLFTVLFIASFVEVFLLLVEYFFFEEFHSRFNTVAVDYLIYPQEVFTNIWESYHVTVVILVCLLLSVSWTWGIAKLFSGIWQPPQSAGKRWGLLLGSLFSIVLLGAVAGVKRPPSMNDRVQKELGNNGALSFLWAGWTRNLDYAANYQTLPLDEAFRRTRELLTDDDSTFKDAGPSIERRIGGDANKPRLNVVLCLEESLGSEFWGSLGRPQTLTPEMDKLANEEGILFTNLYASGNRTVRGMEGVLSSMPPLPGDSIVKRDHSDNVETIARVLKRDGYETLFVYGGRGLFDGMRSYAVRNGYDRFVEQKNFEPPTFTTAWGVCDEDIFNRAVREFRELSLTGKPFFGTILSVSNHKPYTYPKGRIPENPDSHKRNNAVKYSDYALGKFFRDARKESFWTNTIFVVVADHGARVYGQQSIPIHSYEIPLMIAGPAVVKNPVRISQLGCSLDVGPTVLGLIGRPYDSTFFGRDLLKLKPESGRVFLNHNRDIGMLAGDRMVTLGLMQKAEFYQGDPKHMEMIPLPHPTDHDLELKKQAIAIYQVADELYTRERYRVTGGTTGK